MTAFETALDATPPPDSGHRFDAGRRWEASLALRFAACDGATRLARALSLIHI